MDRLKPVLTDIERELGAMMAPARERIMRRVRAAYWIGATDGLEASAPSAERRSVDRDAAQTRRRECISEIQKAGHRSG